MHFANIQRVGKTKGLQSGKYAFRSIFIKNTFIMYTIARFVSPLMLSFHQSSEAWFTTRTIGGEILEMCLFLQPQPLMFYLLKFLYIFNFFFPTGFGTFHLIKREKKEVVLSLLRKGRKSIGKRIGKVCCPLLIQGSAESGCAF